MLSTGLLVATALAAGVTGAWSPCGFSMVETLAGAAGRAGPAGRRLVRTSCATFAFGAVVGGALTFTALSGLGALLGAGTVAALTAAAAVALAAALADALGVRVAPQIRRQVPEPWRRTLPLPLAAAFYGVLLGLGFTTFVLAFAVWALAAIAVAVGDPATGLAIGVAFGLGRALPVVTMAPRHDTLGARLATRMAEQPRLLRRLRMADGALLAAAAVALALAPARAAGASSATPSTTTIAAPATDPSAGAGGVLAWRAGPDRPVLRLPGATPVVVDGREAAVGGARLAVARGGSIEVTDWSTGAPVASIDAPRASQLAVSSRWLAWRAPAGAGAGSVGRSLLRAVALGARTSTRMRTAGLRGPRTLVVRTSQAADVGRPALAGDRLVYAIATRNGSRIVMRDLARRRSRVVLRSRRTLLAQPALRGHRLLFVEASACDQRLRVADVAHPRRPRTLLRIGGLAARDPGHDLGHTPQGSEPGHCPPGTPPRARNMLWTTALAAHAAYVTLLQPRADPPARTTLARVPL